MLDIIAVMQIMCVCARMPSAGAALKVRPTHSVQPAWHATSGSPVPVGERF